MYFTYLGLFNFFFDFNQIKKGTLAADEEPDRALMWQKARKIKIDDDEDSDQGEIGKRIVSI